MENLFNKIDDITKLKEIPSIKVYGQDKKENPPFFTIAIPTFKRPSTLKQAIESALYQVGFNDYNIIICDNNPERNDSTEMMMKEYDGNRRISYYKNAKNVGMSGNWNKCAMLSDSERFLLLHDDDILSPYALKVLRKVLDCVASDWGLIKPNLMKFDLIENISFLEPKLISLSLKHNYHYWGGDCTGAPTCVLFNREKFLLVGGSHSQYYPSMDYVLSFQINQIAKVYTIDGILGGYRVGLNESLSDETMNKFFDMKFTINNMIFDKYPIPKIIRKSVLTKRYRDDYEWAKRYYNMPDYIYTPQEDKVFKTGNVWMTIFSKLYYKGICRLLDRISRRNIQLS